jgi:hypothetical protein
LIADLHDQTHANALLFLLNEYAKDPMGGSAELSAFAKKNAAIYAGRHMACLSRIENFD